MNRRGFISFFGKGAAAGALAGAAKIVNAEPGPEVFDYRGFRAEWTGWKQSHDSDRTVGQWLAKSIATEYGVYASYPGGEGQYHDYWAFDTGPRHGQVHIDKDTSESVKDSCQEDAKKRLIVRIDHALALPPIREEFIGLRLGQHNSPLGSRVGMTSGAGAVMIGDKLW